MDWESCVDKCAAMDAGREDEAIRGRVTNDQEYERLVERYIVARRLVLNHLRGEADRLDIDIEGDW